MLASVRGEALETKPTPSVVHLLQAAARATPDFPAVTWAGATITYDEYAGLVAGLARRLKDNGAAGERVAVVLPNSIDAAVALFAAQAAGAQVVPVNPFYTARELNLILTDAAPKIVILDRELAPAIGTLTIPPGYVCLESGALLDPAWAKLGADALEDFLPYPNALAMLQYTSGTTGRPKGVDIRHIQVTTNIEQREARLPTRSGEEAVLCVMPLFHVFAQAMCLYLAVRARSRLVILPRYKPEAVMAALVAERITTFPAGPTVFTGLLQTPEFASLDFSLLRTCYSGSAPLPEEILRRWHDVTGTFIFEGYGQTEAGPVLTYIGPDTARKPGSVGPPLADTTIEIVDLKDRNKVLARGDR